MNCLENKQYFYVVLSDLFKNWKATIQRTEETKRLCPGHVSFESLILFPL